MKFSFFAIQALAPGDSVSRGIDGEYSGSRLQPALFIATGFILSRMDRAASPFHAGREFISLLMGQVSGEFDVEEFIPSRMDRAASPFHAGINPVAMNDAG